MAFPTINHLNGQIAGTAIQAFSDLLTDTSADAKHPVGTFRVESAKDVSARTGDQPYGEVVWVYVKNDEGSALAAGDLLVAGNGAGDGTAGYLRWLATIGGASTLTALVTGVAGHAIPSAYFGWVIRNGYCEAKGDGSVAAGDRIVAHTSGQVDTLVVSDTAATDESRFYVGVATEADGSAGELFTILLDLPCW
jgi:hypothetical protein